MRVILFIVLCGAGSVSFAGAQAVLPTVPALRRPLPTKEPFPAVPTVSPIDSLVHLALATHPALKAATARVDAARARLRASGIRPDPMLMAGVQNFPVSEPGFSDFMTMKMVGLQQTIPYPGKLRLQRHVAQREVESAQVVLDATRRQVARDVQDAYYEIAFLDHAFSIVVRHQEVLGGFIRITESRYSTGVAGQQDVLKAQVEATRLAETAVILTEQRRAALARLNALLDRPSETPLDSAIFPSRLTQAAVAAAPRQIEFTSPALGARAANSPFPSLEDLQAAAMRGSTELQAQQAMIAAQAARIELARKDHLPDVDIAVEYGQRNHLSDMVSLRVAVPIPLHKRQKQDALVSDANATLVALTADRDATANALRADIARLLAELERERTQLALYVKALLPQGRASLSTAVSSYQVGKVDFLTVLESQATVFTYETDYYRALSDFAKHVAELEQLVGKEIL